MIGKFRRNDNAKLATTQEEYKKLGLRKGKPELWENGLRTNGNTGSYEWWNVECEFECGTDVNIVFYTKDFFDIEGVSCPTAVINITYPDGTIYKSIITEGMGAKIRASKEVCDVKVGNCSLKYDKGQYKVKWSSREVECELELKSILPMWREETGYWYAGKNYEKYIGWLVGQPSTYVEGAIKVDNKLKRVKGKGFQDHSWGNISWNHAMNHWNIGKIQVGDYYLIISDIIPSKKFGDTHIKLDLIAKDGQIIEDIIKSTVNHKGKYRHNKLKKNLYKDLEYILEGKDGTTYKIELIKESDDKILRFTERWPKHKALIAKLQGFNPTYLRVKGKVKLTVTSSNTEKVYIDNGVWEQVCFGGKTILMPDDTEKVYEHYGMRVSNFFASM